MEFEERRVEAERAFAELQKLKAEGYNVLVDFTAVDLSADASVQKASLAPKRFDVVYRLMKLDADTGEDKGRAAVRCSIAETPPVLRSARSLWPIADWLEREVWDMFGIAFTDRPDIKRLLLYDEFDGHPLRKDYPIDKRQPLIGPPSGEPADNPSFNSTKPTTRYE